MNDRALPERAENIVPGILCGCGFSVFGHDEAVNAEAHRDHACVVGPVEVEPRRWYDAAFSLSGVAIVFILAYAAHWIVKGLSGGGWS